MRLKNRVAVVTGASAGIGEAIAELFEEEGATVVGVDIEPVRKVKLLDVGDLAQWELVVEEIVAEHGTIDILVNNAGLVKAYENIVDVSIDDWRYVLRVNLDGTFFGMRSVIPVMQRAGKGSIVNVSSVWGIGGANGVAAYQASKGAVRTLTKNAAITYVGDGIRANSLHPGMTNTPLNAAQPADITAQALTTIPMGRMASPREIAYGALFLASDESSYMTGAELVVDGGFLAI
jgi:NAD(P)-dependent dehydrogenase (short-subunit alcohol dehydrogenase family)